MASQARYAVNRTGRTASGDRSDRQEQPIRPVEPVVEQKAETAISASCDGVPVVSTDLGDEELVDYEAYLVRSNMEINVVRFPKSTTPF